MRNSPSSLTVSSGGVSSGGAAAGCPALVVGVPTLTVGRRDSSRDEGEDMTTRARKRVNERQTPILADNAGRCQSRVAEAAGFRGNRTSVAVPSANDGDRPHTAT